MIDYNNVKQTIAANLPDNNKQEITAEKLRSTLNEFVDKVETTETGIEENVKSLNDILSLNTPITFSNQGIISYPDGTISYYEGYRYSNPIFIKNGYEVVVKSRGAGFGVICTCNQDGTNTQVVVGSPNVTPTPSDYVTYSWTATEDCYIRVCGQFYFETHPADAWYLAELNIQELVLEDKTFTAELTMAYVDTDGTIFQYANNEALSNNVFKNVASIYFIEIGDLASDRKIKFTPMEEINEGETYKVYFFDEKFNSLGNSALASSTGYVATIPSSTKYLRLCVSSETDLNYSVRYVEVSTKTNVLRRCGVRNFLTTPDYITESGTLKYYRTIFEVPYKGQRLCNLGWFFYSPFYKPTGKKSKLVILYCGSEAYQYNQVWNSFTLNYKSQVFSLVHSGYCVALCSCLTSLYGPNSSAATISDCSGDQLSINAYQSYYEYLIRNFNVEENPYIIGYSNGGMPAGRTNILGDIPAKAIAGGAIVTDLIALFRVLGFAVNINKIMHECGVPDDVVVANGGFQFTEEDFNVLKSQGDILKNYSPLFMSCGGLDWNTWIDTMKNVPFMDFETNDALVQLMKDVKLQSKIPIKIWHARDDVNVSYGLSKFYTEAVNRGGGRAFLRTMPSGAGKHAMGNYGDADSIKVQNYHFKDGTVADTTLFMSEVIDWFDQWK